MLRGARVGAERPRIRQQKRSLPQNESVRALSGEHQPREELELSGRQDGPIDSKGRGVSEVDEDPATEPRRLPAELLQPVVSRPQEISWNRRVHRIAQ